MSSQKTRPTRVCESASAGNSFRKNSIRPEHSTAGADRNNSRVSELLPEGGRNDGLTRYGGGMRRGGASHVEIEQKLLQENMRRCRPPLPENEVRKIAASVARYAIGGPDPLQTAWKAVMDEPYPTNYRKFIALAQELQYARKEFPVALPLKRIAALFDRDWSTVREWRKRAIGAGIFRQISRAVPKRKAAMFYVELTTGIDLSHTARTVAGS